MKVRVIAEAGVNHNGSTRIAKKLVKCASRSGADFVKFQSFNVNNLVTNFAKKADYQIKNTRLKNETQYKMLKKLELSNNQHLIIKEYCKSNDIAFLSTGFDIGSVLYLKKLGQKIFKIPSGEITNIPYLRVIGSFKKEIILSTGMSTLKEVELAVKTLNKSGTKSKKITILHCTTDYPASMKDINLKAIETIKKNFDCKVGYSDHSLGTEASIAAVALGATTIEKHFTIDRNMEGPDHKASLEPTELRELVQKIRNIQVALGDGIKKPRGNEIKNIEVARKSIVAIQNIKVGEKFTVKNLSTKRPGNGISPIFWDKLIGSRSKKNYHKNDLINEKF